MLLIRSAAAMAFFFSSALSLGGDRAFTRAAEIGRELPFVVRQNVDWCLEKTRGLMRFTIAFVSAF
jgi:hypothetical protein